MSPIKQEYNSYGVWGSNTESRNVFFYFVLYYFTPELQGKTPVKNTGDTQEM